MERAYGRWHTGARMTPTLTHGKHTVGAAGSVPPHQHYLFVPNFNQALLEIRIFGKS